MTKTSAHTVAKYIVSAFQQQGEPIINLKLQKLLYYCQAWHLSIYDESLFAEPIEAWVHGPVVPPVYREYKTFRWSPILTEGSVKVSKGHRQHIDEVLSQYGKFSAWQLEKLSHSETPWKEARGGMPPDLPSHSIITHLSMKSYYR